MAGELKKMHAEAQTIAPVTFWNRISSSPLGTTGAVLGIIFFPIAIGVALYNQYDNWQRHAHQLKANQNLKVEPSDKEDAAVAVEKKGESSPQILKSLSDLPKSSSFNPEEIDPDSATPASNLTLLVHHMQTTQPIIPPPHDQGIEMEKEEVASAERNEI